MYKEFHSLADLQHQVEEDKQAKGIGASTLNRYPIRFVLFDNFRDCYEFVEYLQSERDAHVESVDRWIDSNYPDIIISHVELADRIYDHIKKKSPNDCVIAPFSELARFYDNEEKKSFDALLKTIKAIQATPTAVQNNQRVYIPIVGLEGKMETFAEDSQTNIWRLVSDNKGLTYRLILTANNDFGVKGLDEQYTVVNNIREWLNIWKDSKQQITPEIVCLSRSIYANATYAQPDNAFSYEVCDNAYDFLTKGLKLNFGGIIPQSSDGNNWELLAESINLTGGFNFKKYVHSYFEIDQIENYKDFIHLWFGHPSIFDRWLLARYFASINNGQGYICHILEETTNYGTNEFIENMVVYITEVQEEMKIRRYCLAYAAQRNVVLSQSAESRIAKSLQNLPSVIGYRSTLQYFTGISVKEKEIAINWLGQGFINVTDIKNFYPDLYYYLSTGIGVTASVPYWVEQYFAEYKKSKIANKYSQSISDQINKLNSSEISFDKWYNQFKTTYTLLQNRGDIEVFYWIDGLGIDWIPLVKQIINERKEQQIYLNEIMIARSLLPTKTDINKRDLQRLLPEGASLEKFGDLDTLAHRNDNISPFTIDKELTMVRSSIEGILNKYIGKKIAIISDHGLTYLSQLVQGKNMAGVDSDHHGRIAIRKSPNTTTDSNYFRLDDNKTLCALKHESLCAKVPTGQGIHGGCTPEEVLVPIFIISSSPASTNWSAELLTLDVNGSNPRLVYIIKNIPSTETPYVEYNGTVYSMHLIEADTYETEDLVLDANENTVTLTIGDVQKVNLISISTGLVENDLFDM